MLIIIGGGCVTRGPGTGVAIVVICGCVTRVPGIGVLIVTAVGGTRTWDGLTGLPFVVVC